MKYTIEITVAGCTTSCAHCYVGGGHAPTMKFDDFSYCAEKFAKVLKYLDGDIAVTIGNEPFCHPQIAEILDCLSTTLPCYFSFANYLVPTTGTALMNHKNREHVLDLLRSSGANGFMLAVHGNEQAHDRLVNRIGAYSDIFEAADFLTEHGLEILFNLIVSKHLYAGLENGIDTMLSYKKADCRLTVPIYVPTTRMKQYQQHRADVLECIRISKVANSRGISTDPLLKCCEQFNEHCIIDSIIADGFKYASEKCLAPQWKFFNITQELDVYYGNVGAHTKLLGNMKKLSAEQLLSELSMMPANYDYNAYYPDGAFEDLDHKFKALSSTRPSLVYPSKQDCIYALLHELNIGSLLL